MQPNTISDYTIKAITSAMYVPFVSDAAFLIGGGFGLLLALFQIPSKIVEEHSERFTSLEELLQILPDEKRRLGIESYEVELCLDYNARTCYYTRLDKNNFRITMPPNYLRLGHLRHELSHLRDLQPKSKILRELYYTFIGEPRADFYGATAIFVR